MQSAHSETIAAVANSHADGPGREVCLLPAFSRSPRLIWICFSMSRTRRIAASINSLAETNAKLRTISNFAVSYNGRLYQSITLWARLEIVLLAPPTFSGSSSVSSESNKFIFLASEIFSLRKQLGGIVLSQPRSLTTTQRRYSLPNVRELFQTAGYVQKISSSKNQPE